jgi:hypothetical protein
MTELDKPPVEAVTSALVPWAVMLATTMSCYALRKWCQACAHHQKMAIASEAGYDRLHFDARTARLSERAFLISDNMMRLPTLP